MRLGNMIVIERDFIESFGERRSVLRGGTAVNMAHKRSSLPKRHVFNRWRSAGRLLLTFVHEGPHNQHDNVNMRYGLLSRLQAFGSFGVWIGASPYDRNSNLV